MRENTYSPVKWLQYLLYVSIAAAVNALLINTQLITLGLWLGYGLTGITIYLLFRLTEANDRYKTAAIFCAVVLACNIIGGNILGFVGFVCAIIAQFQEYYSHSELVEEQDPRLARSWKRLFWVQFIVGLVLGLLVTLVTVVLTLIYGPESEAPTIFATRIISVVSLGLDVLYLVKLNCSIKLLESEIVM